MSNSPSMAIAFPLLNRPAPLPLGELYIDVARAWIALGRLPEARQALERSFLAGEHTCTWQAHYMIGEIGLYEDNDLNGAVKSLAQAALLAPPEQIATLIDRVHRPLHEQTDIRHVQWLATTWYR